MRHVTEQQNIQQELTNEIRRLMNKKVKELGCTGSHFVTTNGLHDDDHYVTARDMAKISKSST